MNNYARYAFALILLFGAVALGQEVVGVEPGPVVAPPEWLLSALDTLYEVPVIGPIASAIVQWAGVIAVILTSFVSFLMVSLKALRGVLNLAQLVNAAAWLKSFESGKIMYWLRAFSNLPPKKAKPSEVEEKAA